MFDPSGKAALITGGARTGRAVALALARRGCALALAYRESLEAAEETAEAARSLGVAATVIRADATREADIAAAVKEAAGTLGRLDILVNMASPYAKTPEPDSSDWDAAMNAIARGAFLFSIHAAPHMKANGGGRIVNISDWLPASGRPRYRGYVPYYTAKAALGALTESLALELAPDILVNAIAPGPILAPPGITPGENEEVIAATPLARWGGAEEVARAVLFLVETGFTTGECIRVDGGRHLF